MELPKAEVINQEDVYYKGKDVPETFARSPNGMQE